MNDKTTRTEMQSMKSLEPDDSTTTRREFIKRAGLVVAGLTLAGGALAGVGLAQDEQNENDDDDDAMNNAANTIQATNKGMVDLGPATNFKLGSVTDRTSTTGAFISHTASGLIALSPVCTHEGCTPRLSGTTFACPCHGAHFGADGGVLRGPARTPLSVYPLQIKNGRVLVNTNKLTRRSSVQKSDFLKV